MQDSKKTINLLVLSNFMAAFGGGTVLRKGLDVIALPFLHEGSLFAFIIGSAIGFIFYSFGRNKESHTKKIEPWFSIFCSVISIILLCIFQTYAVNDKLI